MFSADSYLAERRHERRRRVMAGIAGVGLLMALGFGLLLSYPPTDLQVTASAGHDRPAMAASQDTVTALR